MEFQPKKILLIRFGAMGDVLLTTPAIRCLRKKFPQAKIDFLVKLEYVPLLRGNPHVDVVIPFDAKSGISGLFQMGKWMRTQKYELIVDFQKNTNSIFLSRYAGVHSRLVWNPERWKRWLWVDFRIRSHSYGRPVPLKYLHALRSLGVEDDGKGLELYIPQEIHRRVDHLLKSRKIQEEKPILALAPGAGRNTKRWPKENYIELGKYFQRQGFSIFLLGGNQDKSLCQFINEKIGQGSWDFSGVSLLETASLITRASVIVTNDTGLMHMACALQKKGVAIFGPTTRELGFFPFRSPVVVVEKPLKCRPCSFHGTQYCIRGHFRCMKEISTQEVVNAVQKMVESENDRKILVRTL